jgi:hypothetical protein
MSRKLLLLTSSQQQQQHRRRKPRRRRRRGGVKKPLEKSYYELSEAERSGLEQREQERADRQRARKIAQGASAPYNTTQFILLDHQAGDADVERLERRLANGGGAVKQRRRTISVEEDFDMNNDDIYADHYDVTGEEEAEEEEEEQAAFLSQQFRRDYDRLNADRLERLAKESIIQEYLLLEKTVERLQGRLEAITAREEAKARRGEADYEFHRGEVPMEPDVAAKIRIFQAEIACLTEENSRLVMENGDLQRQLRLNDDDTDCTSSSSSDSSSSSSSSSSESSEDADESEEDEPKSSDYIAEYVEGLPKMLLVAEEGKTDDTGYESTQSKEQTPEREIRSVAAPESHRAAAQKI